MSILLAVGAEALAAEPARLAIESLTNRLDGPRATVQLVATGTTPAGDPMDLTRRVAWSTDRPEVLTVDPSGFARPHRDGDAIVTARLGSLEASTRVHVSGTGRSEPIGFRHEVLPALSKANCNQGSCHGTPTGKNGFRLSLRGFDPTLDFVSLTRDANARRANPIDPDASLLLQKGSGRTPHEGGLRFHPDSLPYQLIREWIAGGLPADRPGGSTLVSVEVLPKDRVLKMPEAAQQLAVLATFSDGSKRDVTRLARYSPSDETQATVDAFGRVEKARAGEVAILVHFESRVTTARLAFLEPRADFAWPDPKPNNFIDEHLFKKWKMLQIPPSPLADDATFLRRVSLDVTGLPPSPGAIRDFLADTRPDKRARAIDRLLESPEYVDFWTLKWADRLGCNQRFVGLKGAYSYHRWIRDQVAQNVPLDRFVRSIVTAKGSNYTNPPASFYRRIRSPEEATETVSQLFMGVRIQCARCHNHVSERWTQDDYYGLAAFFSQVRYKNGPQTYEIYNKEETIFTADRRPVIQPRTGQVMAPKPPGGAEPKIAKGEDRREALADWLVAPGNPFFAKAAVNRLWFHLFGRGIVDPVDDIRESNPPASAELLQALADDFVAHGFDARHTIRTILNSRTYQLSSETVPGNASDDRYFSHAKVRLLTAEQLLDAVSRITGQTERFVHLPPGTRAQQIPDGEFNHPFLRTFGQPLRSEACECERPAESTLEQALQVVGGKTIHSKIVARDNVLGTLLAATPDDGRVVEELYLATLGRRPTEAETGLVRARFANGAPERRKVAEDLLWALFNHPEFLFQH